MSSLHVSHTQTSISFFLCRMWVLCPASLFYIFRLPFVSLSLASWCFILPPCSLCPTHSSLPGSRLYVHLFYLLFGLHTETSICFFVCRMWVLCPSSMFYILKPTFFSLSLESRCFVLHPCSLYVIHPCLIVSSLYVHLACLRLCLHAQAPLASLSLASGCFVFSSYSLYSTYPCLHISRK